ncbi:MAG: Spy/CpxP family protein refolding chaperone [Candidatus Binatia bacterium]
MQLKNHSGLIATAVILATLAFSSTVSARLGLGHGGWMGKGKLLAELQLTDDQKAQIKSISANDRETIRALHRELREKQRSLMEASKSDPFDEGRVRLEAQELANVQAEMMVVRARLFNKTLSVLTEEQKAKLNNLREERRQRFKEWRERNLTEPKRQG